MENSTQPLVSSTPELQREVAELLVECLNLEDISAAEIDPDAPLFGDGLGMDSIDVLEVALSVGKKYGVQLKADSPDNNRIFGSLRQLSDHIAAQRTR